MIPDNQILGCIFVGTSLTYYQVQKPTNRIMTESTSTKLYELTFFCLRSTLQSISEKKGNSPQHPIPQQPYHSIHPCFLRRIVSFFPPRISSKSSSLVPTLTFFNLGDGRECTPWVYTPFNQQDIALKTRPGPKRKCHFPTIIFRRTVSFGEGNIPWRHLRWPLRMSLLSKSWKGSYPTGSHWQTFKNWKTDWVVHTFISKYSHNVSKWGFQFNKKTCRTRESNYSNHGTKTWILQSGVTLYLFLSVEYFGRISITFNQPRFDKQSYSLPKMWLVMSQTIVHTGRYINSTE